MDKDMLFLINNVIIYNGILSELQTKNLGIMSAVGILFEYNLNYSTNLKKSNYKFLITQNQIIVLSI